MVALGASVVLGISGTTAVVYSTQNQVSSARSKSDRSAQSLGEAGLAYAYSTLFGSGTPTMPNAVPDTTIPMNGGTVRYYGILNGQTWTLVGVGSVPNPGAQGGDVIRTARGRATVGSAQQGTANNAVWNYVYVDSTTTCMPLENSVVIDVPLYVRGDICMKNSAKIDGPILQVGGKVTMENSSHIGESWDKIPEIHIGGGCKRGNGELHNPCTAADQVYGTVLDNQPTEFTKPPVDLQKWYDDAQPGPMHGCTSGSFPGGFDNDSVMNKSRGNVQLLTDEPYDCQVRDAQGNLIGQIAWTGTASSPGTLTIAGTIFIDGNIVFQNSAKAVYQGKATLYASGKITFENSNDVCGDPECDGDWDPLQNLLALVAGESQAADGIDMVNSTRFQGALYAVNDIRQRNSAVVWGPQIARQIYLMNSVENHYVPLGTLLPGMPASYSETVVIQPEPGSWSA
ncbi:MAG TPA: hypothetical protein VF236_10385 [Gaiellaceae bacterium]